MENNITLADIYNVVIKLDGKLNKLEEDFNSLDKKVSDTKKELITKIEDTKQELISYVDKKVDDAKKELITHVNVKVNYVIHKINEETSDFMEKDVYKDYQKLEIRVTDLEEFSKTQVICKHWIGFLKKKMNIRLTNLDFLCCINYK